LGHSGVSLGAKWNLIRRRLLLQWHTFGGPGSSAEGVSMVGVTVWNQLVASMPSDGNGYLHAGGSHWSGASAVRYRWSRACSDHPQPAITSYPKLGGCLCGRRNIGAWLGGLGVWSCSFLSRPLFQLKYDGRMVSTVWRGRTAASLAPRIYHTHRYGDIQRNKGVLVQ